MICPRCQKEMTVQVIETVADGSLNLLECAPCHYTKPIPQARPFDIQQYRSRVAQMMEAA